MSKFLVLALPRSRTFWLSRFLSYGDHTCGHEEARHLRSLDDVKSWLSLERVGSAETAVAPFWRSIPTDTRVVTVRRDPAEVVQSLLRAAPGLDRTALERLVRRLDAKLDQIEARRPDVLSVQFDELATEAGARSVFEFCLPYRWDAGWWEAMADVNLQTPLVPLLEYARAYRPQLDKMAKEVKHRTLADKTSGPVEAEGITFQQEPFDDWYRDCLPLLTEHMVVVGEAPDDHARKNLVLLERLSQLGALQVTTARSNGRMFGYLMTLVGPSLELQNDLEAMNLTFYASPEVKGLGMKLQRASLDYLRGRGVAGVFMRAGVRGSGPKLGALYRRLGAEDYGQMYKLELKVA